MKPILFSLIALCWVTAYSQEQPKQKLVHFMQQEPAPAATPPYGNNAQAAQYVQSGDAKIYYEVYGNGTPIVVLHGGIYGSTFEMFRIINNLKKHYQVIAVSTRGHGKSEIGSGPVSLEKKANDVMAVIRAVTRDSVTVLGFSDGAYTGFKLAAMYPQRIKKLIAIGASELYPGTRLFKFDARQAVALDTVYWQQQFKLMPEPNRLQESFDALAKMYNEETVGKELFQSIRCPVLVLSGDRDPSNPIQQVVNTAAMIPHAQLSIIPNTTHVVFLENFPAVWAAIEPFLPASVELSALPISFDKQELVPVGVSMSLEKMEGSQVVKVIKDPAVKKVDEPTYVRINGIDFEDGTIEVKVLSRFRPDAPEYARGFIGLAFRINDSNTRFESMYIRPANARAEDQVRRNHTIQYFAYPDQKFDRLRKDSPEKYESYADMAMNEWITLRMEVRGQNARLFINDNQEPALVVKDLKNGMGQKSAIGLWVDIGTEGYFKDLKVIKREKSPLPTGNSTKKD